MSTIDKKLGRRISGQRRAAGLTQAALAERVDVQPETISRIETGGRATSLALVGQISEALHIEMYELFRSLDINDPRNRAVERLVWFASRLTPAEIELVMTVGAAVLTQARGSQSR
jgi:transcriptional regulator with XRE-family HTH domain